MVTSLPLHAVSATLLYFIVQVVTVLKGHTKKVNRVVYHPQEDTVITGSHDATVRVWNVPTSQTMQVRVTYRPCRGVRT